MATTRGTDITHFKRRYRERNEGAFPSDMVLITQKQWDLKYGENPNQHAAMYSLSGVTSKRKLVEEILRLQREAMLDAPKGATESEIVGYLVDKITGNILDAVIETHVSELSDAVNLVSVRSDGQGKGGLSLTNTMDIGRGMDSLKYFKEPAAVIQKHTNVSGFAKQTKPNQTLTELYRLARDSDRRSNFGGTVVVNRPLDMETAEAMYELYPDHFVDVIAAPEFEQGVLKFIEGKTKYVRIAQFSNKGLEALPKFQGDQTHGLVSVKEIPGGLLGIQDPYLTSIKSQQDLVLDPMIIEGSGARHIIERDPTAREIDDGLTSWWLNIAGARSNGVLFVKNGILSSAGAGQVERVGAVEQAIVKGMQKAMDREKIEYDPLLGITGYGKLKDNPFIGAACSSDAFFPNIDSIRLLGRIGVTTTIQPFGSIKDAEIIDEANKWNIAMPATGERAFGHF